MGRTDFSVQFRKVLIHNKFIGYNLNVMRQSACLVINPITVDIFAALFNCTPVDRASDSMTARPKLSIVVGRDRSSDVCCLVHWGSIDYLLLLQISSGGVWQSSDLQLSRTMLSPCLCFFIVLKCY